MWLYKDRLKGETTHFRLPSTAQKRRLIKLLKSSLISASNVRIECTFQIYKLSCGDPLDLTMFVENNQVRLSKASSWKMFVEFPYDYKIEFNLITADSILEINSAHLVSTTTKKNVGM